MRPAEPKGYHGDVDLFESAVAPRGPLADRMRPRTLADVVGQAHLIGEGKLLARAIATDTVPSMVLAGPPGTGKTSLARVIANETKSVFVQFNAVLAGVPELRKALDAADERRAFRSERTILFVDEIHRFNKAQQDALLPHVERGAVTLIGATTENPSFAVNAALLSRARVFVLEPLGEESIVALLRRALSDGENGLGGTAVAASDEALQLIARATDGDARRALSALEVAVTHAAGQTKLVDVELVREALGGTSLRYDKKGDEHYDVASAFIKSLRGSDPDASLYWMFRMLESGEDPLFVLRRLIIFASEDIGNADPKALEVAVAADAAFRRIGLPEGLHPISQACVYLATAPKSNATYDAWKAAREAVRSRGALAVPKKLRNAVTAEMKSRGLGEGYRYPHDEGGYAPGETYLPDALAGTRFYEPKPVGYEARIREHLERLRGRPR